MLLTLLALAAPQIGSGGNNTRFTLPSDFGAAGTGSIELQLGIYNREDSGGAGNPFLDETLTVIEPIVVFDYNYTDTFAISGLVVYDNVSSASIERLSQFPEQSGASGDFYVGADIGLRWKTSDQTSIGARAGFSTEYDYRSIHVGGDYGWEREDKNAKVMFSVDAFFDTIETIRFDGRTDPDEDRTSLATTLSWYQVLGERTHGTFGATLATQDGFLSTAYNGVFHGDGVGGMTETEEQVPDSRLRTVAFARVRRLLVPGMSAELGARFYNDDWGITGFDVAPRWLKSFRDGRHVLELRYRFYSQTAADFYSRELLGDPPPELRSQDSSLGDFSSHTFGSTWRWNTGPGTRWTFSLDYAMRDDDLDNIHGFVGYRWSF